MIRKDQMKPYNLNFFLLFLHFFLDRHVIRNNTCQINKNPLEKFNNRVGITDDKLSELEDRSVEFTQSKYREKCRVGEHEQSLSDWETKMCQSAREGEEKVGLNIQINNSFKVPKFDEKQELTGSQN